MLFTAKISSPIVEKADNREKITIKTTKEISNLYIEELKRP